MFQDEARFGRISDTRYCWCRRPARPLVHAMVLDGTGRHKSQDFLLPDNLRLLLLPPYSPELNPQAYLWDELREKHFHNRVFDSIEAPEDHLVVAPRNLETLLIASRALSLGTGLLMPLLLRHEMREQARRYGRQCRWPDVPTLRVAPGYRSTY